MNLRRFKLVVMLAVVFAAACSSSQSPSPSAVLKSYVEAAQKGDVATMRSHLSKGSIEMLDKLAKGTKTDVDSLLRREASIQQQKLPETRNEAIEKETATVEIKNELTGEFDLKMPFVKENGEWKLARDKMISEQYKKALDENQKKLDSMSNTAKP